MTASAVAARNSSIRLGPAGRFVLPFFLMGALVGWAAGGVGLVFPAFGIALWTVALWHARRQSSGVELRALDSPPHWTGEAFLFELELHTQRPRTLRDLTISACAHGNRRATSDRPIAFLSRLEGGTRVIVHCGHRHLQRGRQTQLEVSLHSTFPLALVRVERHYTIPVDLLAWPRLGAWRGEAPPPHAQSLSIDRRSRRAGDEEFHQLSPWREGMSRRRIHWKHSARRGMLLRQELEGPTDGPVVIELLLNTCPTHAGRGAPRKAFESAVVLTATLVDHHLRKGVPVHLILGSGEDRALRGLRGRGGRVMALNALAEVKSERVSRPEMAGLLQAALGRAPTLLVLAGGSMSPGIGLPGDSSTRVLDVEDSKLDTVFRRSLLPESIEQEQATRVAQ